MILPSETDIRTLHEKYAPSPEVLTIVYEHCQIVWDIARQLMQKHSLNLDPALVEAACMLHDIGVYKVLGTDGKRLPTRAYIEHGVLGEAILREEGFPEALQRVASHHTGVGLSRTDIKSQNLPLPDQDYLADTPLEQLVMYADKFHSKTTPPEFHTYESYEQYTRQFSAANAGRFAALKTQFGLPDLVPLSEKYGYQIH